MRYFLSIIDKQKNKPNKKLCYSENTALFHLFCFVGECDGKISLYFKISSVFTIIFAKELNDKIFIIKSIIDIIYQRKNFQGNDTQLKKGLYQEIRNEF